MLCSDVFRTQEHFEGAVSPDESGQPGHRAAARDHSHAHLPLRDDGLFAAGKTHVAGERDLAAVAGRTATNKRDGGDWQVRQTHEEVRPRLQAGWALRDAGQVFDLGREIGVIQEVVLDCAVEDYDSDLLVGLQSLHDFLELLDHLRSHHVERRVIDRYAPIGGRPLCHANLCGLGSCACGCHGILLYICLSRNRLTVLNAS